MTGSDSATETSESDVDEPVAHSVGKSSYNIQLDGYHARGVAVIHTRTVVVLLTCSRCNTRAEASLTPNREITFTCTKCSFPMSALVTPSIIHEQSPVAGRLNISGCSPFELLVGRCGFSVDVCCDNNYLLLFVSFYQQCLNCNSATPIKLLQGKVRCFVEL